MNVKDLRCVNEFSARCPRLYGLNQLRSETPTILLPGTQLDANTNWTAEFSFCGWQ